MSEVASRSSARGGRGSARGGRGGFAGRGGRRTNGDSKPDDTTTGAFDDEGDFAELRKQYGDKTSVIREMFPDWSEVDVLYALQETNGDENEAVTRIAEGTISQWDEVSKAKKAPRKPKETAAPAASNESTTTSRPARGGRIASESGRGRGRGSERGGRGGRGRATQAPATNGTRKEPQQLSVATEDSPAWGESKPKSAEPEAPAAVAEAVTSSAPAAKTWASMLRQTAVKPQPKPKEPAAPVQPEEPIIAPEPEQAEPETIEAPEEKTPIAEPAAPAQVPAVAEPEVALQPSKDELTETNLEQVVDESHPPATATAASTTADSWDPRQNPTSTSATPLSASYQQHQAQAAPASSGYAAAAIKATTDRTARVPSFQRRVLDQEEAVRMPGNREVDRAAVQFGAFNLNDGDEDLDGEREEPETRAQPPAESPVAHPRASLPPVSQPSAVPDAFAQKQPGPPGAPSGPASSNAQFGRYGQAAPHDTSAAKPQDPFAQQIPSSQPPFDNFSTPTSQPQTQQPGAAFSSAPSEYSSYYTAGQHDRNPYNYYGQQFGQQQGAQGQPDNAGSQQRGFGGYNASQQADSLSQYPQSGMQSRLGAGAADSQNSGSNTPNPTSQAQQPQQQQTGPGSQPQSHGQQYPGYNHPYYSNPYYHQYYSGYGQGSFGPYGGKNGMYGQPYGGAPYDHASSPGAFNQSSGHRDSGIGSGLGDYGRGNAAQGGNQPGLGGSSSFGSMHDSFARGSSAFQSQTPSFSGQTQPGSNASTDELKPFSDSKTASGPSPALGGARPGSATNNGPGAGLPPPQGSQMGGAYGAYPGHMQSHGLHGNSGYGMGGAAGGNQHGNNPYGSYGQGFGSGGYYGGGQQQQRGGWGGNYH